MKMENEIKAPFDGIISTVAVTKGAAVNAGMALLVMT
jgi:biotin carboxyl carrier protein